MKAKLEKLKTIFLYLFPYLFVCCTRAFRVYRYNHSKSLLSVLDYERIIWIFSILLITVIEIVVTRYMNAVRRKMQEDSELATARRIQYGMVPPESSYEGKNVEVAALMQPAKNVGGDFYDIIKLSDDKTGIVIGDVSGKGIPAALFMTTARQIIRDRLKYGLGPCEALKMCNNIITNENPENMFVTAIAAVYDPADGSLKYANAGHMEPILIGNADDTSYLHPDTGVPLGIMEDIDLVENEMTLLPGQGFLLYTDGVTEAVNKSDEQFGEKRLLEVAKNVSDRQHERQSEKIISGIKKAVFDFAYKCEQFDDFTEIILLTDVNNRN